MDGGRDSEQLRGCLSIHALETAPAIARARCDARACGIRGEKIVTNKLASLTQQKEDPPGPN